MNWAFASRLFYDAMLAAACWFAIRHGERAERVGAAIMAGASGATAIAKPLSVTLGLHTRPITIAFDLGTMLLFDALTVRSRKFWPMWATGAALALLALDVAITVFPLETRPYFLLRGKFAYVQLLAMVLGAASARRRRAAAVRGQAAGLAGTLRAINRDARAGHR